MTPEHVESIMADLAEGDPLDFADVSIGEHEARALMAVHLCEVDRTLAGAGLDADARLEIMAAIAAHALVENMLLNLANLRRSQVHGDFRDWMRRHGIDGTP